jgi:hypothetical protein
MGSSELAWRGPERGAGQRGLKVSNQLVSDFFNFSIVNVLGVRRLMHNTVSRAALIPGYLALISSSQFDSLLVLVDAIVGL